MEFEAELDQVLPADLPNRDAVVRKGAEHLRLIVEANAVMNLTRIVSPLEAAIKHVLDSVIPWRLFSDAEVVLDAGTGPGFPGIPLALALPGVRFTLCESTGKKARFVESVVESLGITNAEVTIARAEDVCRDRTFDVVTARAFAPISRAAGWFTPAARRGARVLLYKGPDADNETAEAAVELKKVRLTATVILRYDLPHSMGGRTIVELVSKG